MPTHPHDHRRQSRSIARLGIALQECGATIQRVGRHLPNAAFNIPPKSPVPACRRSFPSTRCVPTA